MRKKIKVKIIEESLWDRLPQHVKDEINGIINSKPKEMVEVVHGEWLEKEVVDNTDEDFVWKIEQWQSARCSVCGKYHTTPYMYYFDNFNYCPNCGARMEGKEE